VLKIKVKLYKDNKVELALKRIVEELIVADKYPIVKDINKDATINKKTKELLERIKLTLEEG
jgi:hypothetical protein